MTTDPLPRTPAIHAPWRDAYMKSLTESDRSAGTEGDTRGSFLRDYWEQPELDGEHHVIARLGEGPAAGMILLNKYPYANGHLLVALAEARGALRDYSAEQQASLWAMVTRAAELCEHTLHPQGLNIGINQGAAAGAGVPQHLHAHVVPRWNGDVNFITVVGGVRVIPSALESMARRYRDQWASMQPGAPRGS